MSEDPTRKGRFDGQFVATGGLLTGGFALGIAVLLRSWLGSDSGVGPTAAALSEAFSLLLGAAIGLAVGAAFVAFAARQGARIVSGLLAGLFGYVVVLAPALVLTAPSDVSTAESVLTAVFAATLVTPPILLGAGVGAAVAGYGRPGFGRRIAQG